MEDNLRYKKQRTRLIICIAILILIIIGGICAFFVLDNMNKKEDDTPKKEVGDKTQKEEITPLMYEITKEGSDNKIYLFGSMHSVNLDEFDFPDYVINAYNNSDYLAVEFDILKALEDPNVVQNELKNMTYQDGSTIKDHISEETYKKLVEKMEEKYIYNSAFDLYSAYFFESLLSSLVLEDAGISSDDGVDTYFLQKAKDENKKILEVESYELQSNILTNFSDRLYELMLLSYLDYYDDQVEGIKELYQIWKNGDPKELIKLVEDDEDTEGYSLEDIKLYEEYNKALTTDRNIGMTDKLIDYFENNKKVFFMVGAAHLIGDDGIANLLINEGYTVTQINK